MNRGLDRDSWEHVILFSDLDTISILRNSDDPELQAALSDLRVLRELSQIHGLPYVENIDLLIRFSRLDQRRLARYAIMTNDIRVIKGLDLFDYDNYDDCILGVYEFEFMSLVEYAAEKASYETLSVVIDLNGVDLRYFGDHDLVSIISAAAKGLNEDNIDYLVSLDFSSGIWELAIARIITGPSYGLESLSLVLDYTPWVEYGEIRAIIMDSSLGNETYCNSPAHAEKYNYYREWVGII